LRRVRLWDAISGKYRDVLVPTTYDQEQFVQQSDAQNSQSCFMAISGRKLHHDVHLLYWTVEDFLEIGAPFDISGPHYQDQITHDEHQLLFGIPEGSDGERAFQKIVSVHMKEEELQRI
jgi:hypothetical protein